jgi:hypothetical protein
LPSVERTVLILVHGTAARVVPLPVVLLLVVLLPVEPLVRAALVVGLAELPDPPELAEPLGAADPPAALAPPASTVMIAAARIHPPMALPSPMTGPSPGADAAGPPVE